MTKTNFQTRFNLAKLLKLSYRCQSLFKTMVIFFIFKILKLDIAKLCFDKTSSRFNSKLSASSRLFKKVILNSIHYLILNLDSSMNYFISEITE